MIPSLSEWIQYMMYVRWFQPAERPFKHLRPGKVVHGIDS